MFGELMLNSTEVIGAELGTWKGDFAARCLSKTLGTLMMVDPFAHLDDWNMPFNIAQEKFEAVFEGTRKRVAPFGPRGLFLRAPAYRACKVVPDEVLDWIYIDGDHTLQGAMADLLDWYPKVKLGGVIFGHDYRDTPGGGKFDDVQVKLAVSIFARAKGLVTHTVSTDGPVFAVLKTAA